LFIDLSGLDKNYATEFHKIRWKGGTRTAEETIRICW